MASPQKEKGYTPVAHEILDQICQFRFNGAQFRIIIKLWRETYGYHTKDTDFALDYIQKCTKLSESTVKKEVSLLIKERVFIVTKKQTKTLARRIKFNKNYEQWNIPKSGDELDQKAEVEVQDTTPQSNHDEVQDTVLDEGQDTVPNNDKSNYFEGQCSDPIKDIKDLKIKFFKDNTELFEKFYSFYPRRISIAAARKAWMKLIKEDGFDPGIVMQNTLNFAETCKLLKTESRYIPHPSTYLNQKRFNDYPIIDPEGILKGKETKFDSNMNFLRSQLGGVKNESGASHTIASQSGIVLSEQDT